MKYSEILSQLSPHSMGTMAGTWFRSRASVFYAQKKQHRNGTASNHRAHQGAADYSLAVDLLFKSLARLE